MSDRLTYRAANFEDYKPLSDFLAFEYFIHRHLDWRTPLDWLGQQPFLLAEKKNEIMAAFATPNEVPAAAWIRLFACSAHLNRLTTWNEFMSLAKIHLPENVTAVYALGIENWFAKLLEETPFKILQEIIVYARQIMPGMHYSSSKEYDIRALQPGDLEEVTKLDNRCFPPHWQMSQETMQLAYLQSSYATIIEKDSHILAYQITTEGFSSVHLARIAVSPDFQKKGLASVLLTETLAHFSRLGIQQITVNTQSDNFASQTLYKKFGFHLLPEHYPVYFLKIR